ERADDHLGLGAALRAKHVGGIEPDTRGQSEYDIGDRRTVRRALMALVRQRFRLAGDKNTALDWLRRRAPLPAATFQNRARAPGVNDADRHALAGGTRVPEQPVRT